MKAVLRRFYLKITSAVMLLENPHIYTNICCVDVNVLSADSVADGDCFVLAFSILARICFAQFCIYESRTYNYTLNRGVTSKKLWLGRGWCLLLFDLLIHSKYNSILAYNYCSRDTARLALQQWIQIIGVN